LGTDLRLPLTPTLMLTLILGTLIIAMTYGAFWHNQPARPPNDQRRGHSFRLGRLVNHALEWLVLMPHVSNPAEEKEPAFLTGKIVMPDSQTPFFERVLRALAVRNPWRRFLTHRAETRPSIPAHVFKTQALTNELAAEKTA
jgi:hypothetical protein